jgi:hypothetical protein
MIKPVDAHRPISPERRPGLSGGRPATAPAGYGKITACRIFAFIMEFFFTGYGLLPGNSPVV